MKSPFIPPSSVSYLRSSRPRHRGQALVLAVTIMLLAALLSAGFLLVVSGNLNQTARNADKTRALEAARAGMSYINTQLTYGLQGDRWRPQTDPELASSTARSYYLDYWGLVSAQGWAGKFALFPGPSQPLSNTPQFLARVDSIARTLPVTDPDASHAGALKLTIIGLSPDDPSTFTRLVAYKEGAGAPMGNYMRTITNWDFAKQTVPVGSVASYDSTSRQLVLKNVQGNFPPAPFTVLIGSPGTGNLRGAVVQTKTANNSLTLALAPTLADNVTPADPQVDERIEMAASLGAPNVTATSRYSAVDFNTDGTLDETTERVTANITNNTNPGSIFSNGSLLLYGDVQCSNLNAVTTNPLRGNIEASSLIARATDGGAVTISGTSASGANASAVTLAASSNTAGFPFTSSLSARDANSLVSDGEARLTGNLDPNRQTAPVTPPDIAYGQGVARYRELTRDSKSTIAGSPNGALFGYGQGIYINNPEDREKIYDSGLGHLREMTQEELIRMWLSPTAATDDFTRLAAPKAATDTTSSLEQQHLRGWIGPDEFRARGALIELLPDIKKVSITLDARGDGTTLNEGPVGVSDAAFTPQDSDQKAWRDPNGNILPGVYHQLIDWPANGVIFAEGNVRVKGGGNVDPATSITIVSQGNIYVDGSLNANVRKVLLLARKNVIANPTAMVSRVEGWTRAASATGGGTTLTVKDASVFQIGDWINIDGNTTYAGRITNINGADLTLDATTPAPSVASGVVIRAAEAPLGDSYGTAPGKDFNQVGRLANVLQRHFPNGGATSIRFAFRHSAEQRQALQWEFSNGNPERALAESKTTSNALDTILTGTNKNFVVHQDDSPSGPPDPPSNTDTFPLAPATTTTLDDFVNTVISATPNGLQPPPAAQWTYNPSVVTTNAYNGIHPWFLAGQGARKNLSTPETGKYPWYQNLLDVANNKTFVATSLTPSVDGLASVTLNNDHWGLPVESPFAYLGFNPVGNDAGNDTEDVYTTDASFYTNVDGAYALDSKVVGLSAAPTQTQSTFGLRFTRDASGAPLAGFSDPSTGATTNLMPIYRLASLKVENVTVDGTTHQFTKLAPGLNMNINAFVYAQEGSWFVIPMPYFSQTTKAGDDVNRDRDLGDGTTTPTEDEKFADARFQHYNYQINFTGAITENHTAIINDAGTVPGAVAQWSDRCATFSVDDTNTATPVTTHTMGVIYNFDPSYLDGTLDTDNGFIMPQSNQLLYQD